MQTALLQNAALGVTIIVTGIVILVTFVAAAMMAKFGQCLT